MNKPDYVYQVADFHGRNVIAIVDMNLGNMSVTNGIEQVVEDIAREKQIEPHHYMIVYCDSEAVWDGWDPVTSEFIPLNTQTWEQAVDKYISLQLVTN